MLVCLHFTWRSLLVDCVELHMGRGFVLRILFVGLEGASVMMGIRSV